MAASEKGWAVRLSGTAVADPLLDGELSLAGEKISGARRLGNGHRIVYVRQSEQMTALLAGAGKGNELFTAGSDGTQVLAVEYDEHDRPVDLAVTTVAALPSRAELPPELKSLAAELVRGSGKRVLEVERHLDLTSAANRDAAIAYLKASTARTADFGVIAAATQRLTAAIRAGGTTQARSYSIGGSDGGFSGEIAAGIKIGGAYEHSSSWSKLLGAADRDATGRWSIKGSCRPIR